MKKKLKKKEIKMVDNTDAIEKKVFKQFKKDGIPLTQTMYGDFTIDFDNGIYTVSKTFEITTNLEVEELINTINKIKDISKIYFNEYTKNDLIEIISNKKEELQELENILSQLQKDN